VGVGYKENLRWGRGGRGGVIKFQQICKNFKGWPKIAKKCHVLAKFSHLYGHNVDKQFAAGIFVLSQYN
jgi:hypothetical protein